MKTSARRKAREYALQAIYQWHFTHLPMIDIEAQFKSRHKMKNVDIGYFSELIYGVDKHVKLIDDVLKTTLDRDIDKLVPTELTVLRISVYELMHRLDVPYKVVINEALELAKTFGSQEGFKYVNAVLDKLAIELRKNETKKFT